MRTQDFSTYSPCHIFLPLKVTGKVKDIFIYMAINDIVNVLYPPVIKLLFKVAFTIFICSGIKI